MLLGQRDAALRQVEHDTGGHIVEVDEAGFGRQRAAPGRVHRETRVDVTAAVHRGEPGAPGRPRRQTGPPA